ncbi:hypothetical protein ACFFGV_18170 [Pontibacillus salicampi]|uniref:HEPN AbiU2-like domain-containing protein n=1 Tax=Pontibacillus salicampi TaxID=1449801 RepID=A0ABV6LT49_9BACI
MSNTYNILSHFESYKDGLIQEVISLNSFLELYVHIRRKRNDRLEILNKSPAFFQLTQESLLTSVIVGLTKIFERRNKNGRTIYNFLNYIEWNYKGIFLNKPKLNTTEITVDIIKEQRFKLEQQDHLLNNLFAWRDKSFAHMDKKYFEDRAQLGEDFPLTIKQLRLLIELVAEILNVVEGAYSDSSWSFNATNVTDIDNILDWLHKVEPYKGEINNLVREGYLNRNI